MSLADRAEATGAPAFVPDPRLTNEDLAPAEKRNRMRAILEDPNADCIERVRKLLLASDSISYARHRARDHVSRARAALADLAETKSKRLLDAMAEFVADRAV